MIKKYYQQLTENICPRLKWHLSVFFLGIQIMMATTPNLDAKSLPAWSYYKFKPFIIEQASARGLSFDFIALLNKHTPPDIQFHLEILPRKRIDCHLSVKDEGIVVFVSPLFFQDQSQTKFLWSTTVFPDQQEILSLPAKPVQFNGNIESLHGLWFGGILGHQYSQIDLAVKDKKIWRENTTSENSLLKMLLKQRIDFITLPQSTIKYFELSLQLKGKIHHSRRPLNKYERKILIPHELSSIHKVICDTLQTLKKNGELRRLLEKYDIETN